MDTQPHGADRDPSETDATTPDPDYPRIADFSGVAIVALTFLIRFFRAEEDVFENHAFVMLLVLAVPCASAIFIRPFTSECLSQQQRFALAALLGTAVLSWWGIFGEEWLDYRHGAVWRSRLSWLLVFVFTAMAWYLSLGWTARKGAGGHSGMSN